MFNYDIDSEDLNDPPGASFNARTMGLKELYALRKGLDDCINIMEEAKYKIDQ